MRKILIFVGLIVISTVAVVSAVDNSKPETHNTQWINNHGQASKVNIEENCLVCHEERLDCIACHEDVKPRTHTLSWTQKGHGIQSRWNQESCQTCHRTDFCVECHETSVPLNHNRADFLAGPGATWHCLTGCALQTGAPWQSTTAKNCITCHQTRPILSDGSVHVP